MVGWVEFRAPRPDLAEAGRGLLYQFGVGLAFLATVSRDGSPRVHPMCPLLFEEGLFAFIVRSPKRNDLVRDRRYAMHSFPCPDNEDAFFVADRAEAVDDDEMRESLAAQFMSERSHLNLSPSELDAQTLFQFDIGRALLTPTTGHGDPNPQHTVWRP